jgi:hypothetical protein
MLYRAIHDVGANSFSLREILIKVRTETITPNFTFTQLQVVFVIAQVKRVCFFMP